MVYGFISPFDKAIRPASNEYSVVYSYYLGTLFLKGVVTLIRFLVKVVMNGIILVPFLLWYTEATVLSGIVTSIVFSIIAYFIGDRLIFKASNNLVATVADAILAVVYLGVVSAFMNWSFTWGKLLFTAVVLGIVELLYHSFLKRFDSESELQKT